ncbi:MAG: hypothetical protein E7028_08035 [Planctomycetaceae bacterium]|nr:hypothetical protein [Planctomycetaceae bacterium]
MARRRIYASEAEAQEANRVNCNRHSRLRAMNLKEIGPLPEVRDPERKTRCREDLLQFMLEYGGNENAGMYYIFTKPFCEEQIEMIRGLESVLKHGGEHAMCIFRGGCKTTICEWGITWALLYGWQKFAVAVAASTRLSLNIVSNIKNILTENPLLEEDFPEACHPLKRLENVYQRVRGQLLDGNLTRQIVTGNTLRLACVPGAASSMGIVMGVGSDASFRGLRIDAQRPTVVLIDDPQTNRSARSFTQTEERWNNIASSMKGLAGVGTPLAMVATVTVIKKDDLAERILKEWGGKRYSMLRKMPTNMKAWEAYQEMMMRTKLEVSDAEERFRLINEYYIEHRAELDEGAEAAWEENFATNEVSAIQHAMNLYCFDRRAFWSEYQNLPEADSEKEADNLLRSDLTAKVRKDLDRGVVPIDCGNVTMGVDIQKDCLFWMVCAWDKDFGGHVIDYGRYPKGNKKMSTHVPGAGLEEQVSQCLSELLEIAGTQEFRVENGDRTGIDRVIVDSNWGLCHNAVLKVCKMYKAWVIPCLGWGGGPDKRFLYKNPVPGEERGPEWRRPPLARGEVCRCLTYNTNWWKSFVRSRIKTGLHGTGTLTFFKGDDVTHWKLWDHLLGETSSKLTGQYGIIDKWTLKPGSPNHWWDCLVMAAVAASTQKSGPGRNVTGNSGEKKTGVNWIRL